jgi:hypothetical protein
MKADQLENCANCGIPFTDVPREKNRRICHHCAIIAGRHRARCGTSFADVTQAPNRRICCRCLATETRECLSYRTGLFSRGERRAEALDLAKISGKDLVLRHLRMARYAECVAAGLPIAFEPRVGI